MAQSYMLREPIPGRCPVCWQCWTADPNLECACTRSQPDDADQMEAAYLQSARCRSAKLRADREAVLDAARRMRAAIQRHQGRPGQTANVVPITRPLTQSLPYTTRAR